MKASIHKFISDRQGRIVMWQFPNPALIGWAACRLAVVFVEETAKRKLGYMATAFLMVWAVLEITQGVSNFRRLLGAVVLLAITIPFIF